MSEGPQAAPQEVQETPEVPAEVEAFAEVTTAEVSERRTVVHFSDTADAICTRTFDTEAEVLDYIRATPDVQEFHLFNGVPVRVTVQRKSIVQIGTASHIL